MYSSYYFHTLVEIWTSYDQGRPKTVRGTNGQKYRMSRGNTGRLAIKHTTNWTSRRSLQDQRLLFCPQGKSRAKVNDNITNESHTKKDLVVSALLLSYTNIDWFRGQQCREVVQCCMRAKDPRAILHNFGELFFSVDRGLKSMFVLIYHEINATNLRRHP